ncbi:peptide deformylase [Candidatus Roizmanbacteria bacterium RIFOXYB2_FULL_38_10]|uniref:Peptide deformylase n=1 Tax=Candidatus Roizmanbacteria bacterium RIFOXYD1_FULL_38_12 TaxID=1802093 RepID=A0A1F7L1B1_9BACT|nr:MAG: peptide deformylase [Candidatus Roizmanbacteria bacterium RIFOXYA2_FULL_38_14]OGK63905.1 MAG: peptide deformylase [Candidatus Roizmanbacteria bacterium RIFOXYA1_FULL_37_12]OGK65751.1 MAG: peptide deformylase [Candidatus Roizmanbacteria bacterium RIFOXYB1_FULL_40_23]OGK68196.1 MAG: peptide deformylase [Candidatus Roizmanbacteria bacterium RIFOXYB2_FULL_38_10]OGK70156.1 MAG: peptide deformylase [Candidatus Roizmanbacteria bacterium RIFOXYC1_FULL_38_14]OGK72101.1 MAG: peptide deformylase 
MLKIVLVPHKVLTSPTRPVKKIDEKIRRLVYDMEETLISQVEPQGVGLAATQIGLGLSLFIMKPSPKSETEVCINPKILKVESKPHHKDDMVEDKKLEGCLSIPRIWGPVSRARRVLLRYQDLTGATIEKWFTGFKATIVQHEMDHLSGILFTQRSLEQKTPLYEEKDGELEKMKY